MPDLFRGTYLHAFTFHVDLSQISCTCGWGATGGEEVIDRHTRAVEFLAALEERKLINGSSRPRLPSTSPVVTFKTRPYLFKFFSLPYYKTTN